MNRKVFVIVFFTLITIVFSCKKTETKSNWTIYTKGNELGGKTVYAIAIDTYGNKWFGTDSGVSKFDGNKWTIYTRTDGLLNDTVHAILIDTHDNKWFGTDSGISKFDGTTWTKFTKANTKGLLGNSVYAIAIDAQENNGLGLIAACQNLMALNLHILD